MKKNSTRMGLFVWEIPVGKYSFYGAQQGLTDMIADISVNNCL